MNKVGFVYDPVYLEHDTGEGHPERGGRLLSIERGLKNDAILDKLLPIRATEASADYLKSVHSVDYINRFRDEDVKKDTLQQFDTPDCIISPMTYKAALFACGGVLAAVDAVLSYNVDSAFCSVRPPGHHAEHNFAMGFCYFNNIAIASRYLQRKYSLDRVLIFDFDVHHGNGTQHTFESDDSVFYISTHGDPMYCYPGTGYDGEVGTGRGKGYTLNCPLSSGTSDDEYLKVFRERVLPAMYDFKPDFILLSAGFDAHKDDPLADISLTERSYEEITKEVLALANYSCRGRIVSVLEGGYNLLALARSVSAHINVLLNG